MARHSRLAHGRECASKLPRRPLPPGKEVKDLATCRIREGSERVHGPE